MTLHKNILNGISGTSPTSKPKEIVTRPFYKDTALDNPQAGEAISYNPTVGAYVRSDSATFPAVGGYIVRSTVGTAAVVGLNGDGSNRVTVDMQTKGTIIARTTIAEDTDIEGQWVTSDTDGKVKLATVTGQAICGRGLGKTYIDGASTDVVANIDFNTNLLPIFTDPVLPLNSEKKINEQAVEDEKEKDQANPLSFVTNATDKSKLIKAKIKSAIDIVSISDDALMQLVGKVKAEDLKIKASQELEKTQGGK